MVHDALCCIGCNSCVTCSSAYIAIIQLCALTFELAHANHVFLFCFFKYFHSETFGVQLLREQPSHHLSLRIKIFHSICHKLSNDICRHQSVIKMELNQKMAGFTTTQAQCTSETSPLWQDGYQPYYHTGLSYIKSLTKKCTHLVENTISYLTKY